MTRSRSSRSSSVVPSPSRSVNAVSVLQSAGVHASGLIGEVLIVNPDMYMANSGEGYRMYADMRTWEVTEKEKAAKTMSLKYAAFAPCPSVYNEHHHRGWVKFGQERREINCADVWFKAKIAAKAEFDQTFPQLSMPACKPPARPGPLWLRPTLS